jgi:cellulose synthase/poly-beta-1,6-N-acetylglucosamine synthase-like glycosyltransferase
LLGASVLADISLFSLTPLSIWFWLLCAIALLWIKRHRDITIGKREPVLSDQDAQTLSTDPDLPTVSMVVAGKDEAENIERCLRGLLAQQYPKLQLICVNDRSDDATGQIMDRVAAEDERLTSVHVQHLPEGWFGKNNAMRLGLEQATGEWLCFTDADCQFDSSHLIEAAVRYAQRHDVEFLSVLPQLEAGTFWERVIQPVAGAIMIYWTPPQKVNNPASPIAYANGAFMLMRRDAYERLGQHEAVKATLNEDMHFARRAKQVGVRLHVMRGGIMYRVRMYVGFKAAWRGWSRIFYGCFGSMPRLIASAGLLIVGSLSAWLSVLLAPVLLTSGWVVSLAGLAAGAAQISVMWRFYALSGLPASLAITYPLGAVLVLGMLINSMGKALGAVKTTWRGTTYKGGH